MASAREQYRPPDDRVEVAPELRGTVEERWEYASKLGDANTAARMAAAKEQARHEPEPEPATPERFAQEVAAVRTDPDSSVYAPRKHRAPVNTLSRRQALAFALTGKRHKP
jgi:hypothetical protein